MKTKTTVLLTAWVLWAHGARSPEGNPARWVAVAGFPTYEFCAEQQRYLSLINDINTKADKNWIQGSFACFPDTVDPRAPKEVQK